MDITDLQKLVAEFRDARDWGQYHTPKNLAQALSSEVGELNDLYLWDRTPDIWNVQLEMADILIYLLSMADVMGLDLSQCVLAKLKRNGQKYSVSKCYGKSEKMGWE